MWKKGSVLLLAFLLLLTGCSAQASLVRDAVVKTWDTPNYDFKGTLKLVGDFDKVEQLSGEEMDAEAKTLLAALQSGVTLEGSQKDLNSGKYLITLNDDKILRDHNLWTGDKKANLEMLVNKQDLYLKSALDSKYLAISPGSMPADATLDAAKMKELQEKVQDLTLSFLKKYIAQYGYKLNNVIDHGKATVELPNGEKVDTTHLTINMDAKEVLNMLLFTAKDATTNQEVRSFAIDMLLLINQYTDAESKLLKPGTDERKQAELMVDMGLLAAKQEIENFEKTNSVDKLLADAKNEGFEGITLSFDYYITADKLPVESSAKILVSMKDPEGKIKEPFSFGVESSTYAWNWGKATAFSFPTADQVVTDQQLKTDPAAALKAFDEKGYFYQLLQKASEETDLDDIDAVEPAIIQ